MVALATGTGTAHDATVSSVPATYADAGVAIGSGAALASAITAEIMAGLAAGLGAAFDADIELTGEPLPPHIMAVLEARGLTSSITPRGLSATITPVPTIEADVS
jgi:sulfopyruvate decarboxylase TPP-binding subunit